MIGEKHDLIHELPEFKDKIHELKVSNNHFSKLFDKYHDVTKEVGRIEGGAENTSDDYLADLKKQRLALKDEMFSMLSK
ncbi:MAG: DUF465 domain-containing protein [Gammaproteobacteria bacterium]|nr:DUF465 domain-containing protein [Gammaproteobacteria bacterium]